jgi:hypothetical protein
VSEEGHVEDAKAHVSEQVTLARGEVWLLRIAALTGVMGMLSHTIDLFHELGIF